MPLKTDTVQVTINVARDLELPIFLNDPYNFNTDEERPVNHTLGTVTAIDPDIRVKKYPCLPNTLRIGKLMCFFFILNIINTGI